MGFVKRKSEEPGCLFFRFANELKRAGRTAPDLVCDLIGSGERGSDPPFAAGVEDQRQTEHTDTGVFAYIGIKGHGDTGDFVRLPGFGHVYLFGLSEIPWTEELPDRCRETEIPQPAGVIAPNRDETADPSLEGNPPKS